MEKTQSPLSESIAVILGASNWPDYQEFDASPAFENSAMFFMDYLSENGVKASNILDLFDSELLPANIIEEIEYFLNNRLTSKRRVVNNVFVYFVGHGNVMQDQYILATRCVSQNNLELTGLPARQIASTLSRCAPDKRQIIIVDACYAASASMAFMNEGGAKHIARNIRDELPDTSVTRGTTLFCAAGPRLPARAPLGAEYTMFTGALSRVLSGGDPDGEALLSIDRVAELVEKDIITNYRKEGVVRPELHTPHQEHGDLRHERLFPNPAWKHTQDPAPGNPKAKIEEIRGLITPLSRELEWETESRKKGWYRALEKHITIDPWGDALLRQRILEISGADDGQIDSLPLNYDCQPRYGICTVESVTDHQREWRYEQGELPDPGCVVRAELPLRPPATWNLPHKGFTVESRLINSHAITCHDARLRRQDEVEFSSIAPRYPTQCLRMVVSFPSNYSLPEAPQILATRDGELDKPIRAWSEDAAETARVKPFLFYSQELKVAVFQIERALPHYRYAIRWRLPKPSTSHDHDQDAADAREHIHLLLALGQGQREEIAAELATIRDAVCSKHLSRMRRNWSNVHLFVTVFDEDAGRTRVVCSTNLGDTDPDFGWGAGVAGWVMKRKRPVYVNTTERWMRGLYASLDHLPEKQVISVPLPLAIRSDRRNEALNGHYVHCAVASLSCPEPTGQLDRVKSDDPNDPLLAALSSDLAERLLDTIDRTLSLGR
jgi:hypothetical protein